MARPTARRKRVGPVGEPRALFVVFRTPELCLQNPPLDEDKPSGSRKDLVPHCLRPCRIPSQPMQVRRESAVRFWKKSRKKDRPLGRGRPPAALTEGHPTSIQTCLLPGVRSCYIGTPRTVAQVKRPRDMDGIIVPDLGVWASGEPLRQTWEGTWEKSWESW